MFDRREKLFVEIINEQGIKTRKKFPIKKNKVILRKKSGTKPEISAKFTHNAILHYTTGIGPFKRHHTKVLLKEGSKKCLEVLENKVPTLDEATIEDLFNENALKGAGHTQTTLKVPIFLYLMVGALIILGIFQLLLASGRVRFV